jgi:hypothetical protein
MVMLSSSFDESYGRGSTEFVGSGRRFVGGMVRGKVLEAAPEGKFYQESIIQS